MRSAEDASIPGWKNVYLVVIAALAIVPRDSIATDTVDVIELNHFFDEEGRPVFDQVIFWEWRQEQEAFHVLAWRLWKSPAQTPERDWQRGEFRTLWFDADQLRDVRATSYRETWTQFDPELEDRQQFPPNRRRGLAGEQTRATAPGSHDNH
jgi:hypothetical protein